jgi:hypothetical protein
VDQLLDLAGNVLFEVARGVYACMHYQEGEAQP